MAARRDSLTPPERTHTEDPGAHDLDSESEDHFSDAQSIAGSRASPIPKTRVEKVDNEPSYGEVPGTEAYKMREGDAEPDEIAVIKDEAEPEATEPSGPPSAHIPTTVLEETPDAEGAKTPDGKKHESDPVPDLVVKADGTLQISSADHTEADDAHKTTSDDEPIASPSSPTFSEPRGVAAEEDEEKEQEEEEGDKSVEEDEENEENANDDDDDDFGDDFDEFEEGGEADGEDDDFGDFDDGFQEPPAAAAAAPQPTQPAQPQPPAPQAPPALAFPIPDYEGLAPGDVLNATAPYLNGLFPPNDSLPAPPQLSNSIFLSPRSESLWSQLVAPPPLAPPDWIRSRIRRLFLVSLGVPVDLDEILPASKQKKLVLPSLSVPRSDSPRTSSDSRTVKESDKSKNSVARLKQSGANGSNSSVDSQGKPSSSSRKRKGPPPPPELDMVTGQQLCKTTDEALDGMTDAELTAHLKRLEAVEVAAKEALEYWTKRTDEKIGDREAFEGVIESLVAHARKTRK